MVGVMSPDEVWILQGDRVMIVIGDEYHVRTLGQALFHAVVVAGGRALGHAS